MFNINNLKVIIKKKINKSELKEIFKISNIIEEYLNQKEVNQRIQNSNVN